MDRGVKSGLIILVSGILGTLLALIEQIGYNNNYFVNIYLTDATQLPGLMVATIVFFLLCGCVVAAWSH